MWHSSLLGQRMAAAHCGAPTMHSGCTPKLSALHGTPCRTPTPHTHLLLQPTVTSIQQRLWQAGRQQGIVL